jgi:hypothetical protein
MKPPQIHAPRAIAPAMQMFQGFLQSRISEGAQFNIGDTIQCSWIWLRVGADEKGQLSILAPQDGAMPMCFVADCSDALNLVMTQRYVCDSFGVECGWCNARQSVIVIKDIADCRKIFMNRTEQEKSNASGWFFGASDTKLDVNDLGSLELKSLWQLSCEFPQSRDFFLLPQGWQVVFEDRPVVLQDFEATIAQPGSYYASKYQS